MLPPRPWIISFTPGIQPWLTRVPYAIVYSPMFWKERWFPIGCIWYDQRSNNQTSVYVWHLVENGLLKETLAEVFKDFCPCMSQDPPRQIMVHTPYTSWIFILPPLRYVSEGNPAWGVALGCYGNRQRISCHPQLEQHPWLTLLSPEIGFNTQTYQCIIDSKLN